MNFEDIDSLAKNNEKLSERLSLPEMECFLCLRTLYNDYRTGRIEQEAARIEKRNIHNAFDKAQEEYSRRATSWAEEQDRIKRAGILRSALPKDSKNMNDADLIKRLLEIISLMSGENITEMSVIKCI